MEKFSSYSSYDDMKFIRPAGLNELRCIAREDLKLYGSIISLAEYSGPRELFTADFIKALKYCVSEHPALAVVVQDADTEKPILYRIGQMDFTKHCLLRDQNHQDFLEECHNEPFVECSTRPQWRVVIQPLSEGTQTQTSPSFQVAFISSHNILDGMSGPQFHSTFLNALNNPSSTSDFDENPLWQPPQTTPLPPPLEKASRDKLPISWTFLLGPLMSEYLPARISSFLGFKSISTEKVWKGASPRPHNLPPASLVRTKVYHISIPASTLKSILTVCKAHNSRLTGLLVHLIALSLSLQLKIRGKEYSRFIAAITINLRKALQYGEGQMANYPSSVEELAALTPHQQHHHHHHLEATTPRDLTVEDWETISKTTRLLEEKSSTLADQPVGLLTYLRDFRGWNMKNARKPSNISFEISNVGALLPKNDDDNNRGGRGGRGGRGERGAGEKEWRIQDLIFSQSADASGPPMSVNVASTGDGKLNLVFIWSPGALGLDDGEEGEFTKEVAGGVVRELERIADML